VELAIRARGCPKLTRAKEGSALCLSMPVRLSRLACPCVVIRDLLAYTGFISPCGWGPSDTTVPQGDDNVDADGANAFSAGFVWRLSLANLILLERPRLL